MSDKIKIDIVVGKEVTKNYGMGRNVNNLISLGKNPKIKVNIITNKLNLHVPFKSFIASLFFYPFIVIKNRKKDSILHIAKQEEAYLLNFISARNTVVTCHDMISLFNNKHRLIDKLMVSLCIKGLKKADRIITVSNYSKSEIIKYLDYPEKKIDVIYNGLDHNEFKVLKDNKAVLRKYGVSERNSLILFVGTEEPRKNLLRIIKSIGKISKKNNNITLLKVGTPLNIDRRHELKTYIKKLGLENNVKFLDYVSEKDLIKIYNSVDFLVLPSLYEGFGFPALEAMACGCPVITSNTTSLPEVVGDAAITINPYNIDQLAEAMYKLLKNNETRKKLIKKGLKRAKLFTWKKASEETLKIYDEMLKNERKQI